MRKCEHPRRTTFVSSLSQDVSLSVRRGRTRRRDSIMWRSFSEKTKTETIRCLEATKPHLLTRRFSWENSASNRTGCIHAYFLFLFCVSYSYTWFQISHIFCIICLITFEYMLYSIHFHRYNTKKNIINLTNIKNYFILEKIS